MFKFLRENVSNLEGEENVQRFGRGKHAYNLELNTAASNHPFRGPPTQSIIPSIKGNSVLLMSHSCAEIFHDSCMTSWEH